jgi:hypothetical protein
MVRLTAVEALFGWRKAEGLGISNVDECVGISDGRGWLHRLKFCVALGWVGEGTRRERGCVDVCE